MRSFRLALLAGLAPILAAAAPQRAPSLRIDAAAYDLGNGVLHIAFTFANPSDSVLYLDCQVPPRASLAGGTLTLIFARAAAASEGALAGGPAPSDSAPAVAAPGSPSPVAPAAAAVVDLESFPPQRIAGGQTFQGQRRLDRVLGDASARPKFTSLRLVMGYYPERAEGEGPSFVVERGKRIAASPHTVSRKGKPPAPPKPVRIFKTEP
jgi:hypothetical protein